MQLKVGDVVVFYLDAEDEEEGIGRIELVDKTDPFATYFLSDKNGVARWLAESEIIRIATNEDAGNHERKGM